MKKDVNGVITEMTAEEIETMEEEIFEMPPTDAERIDAIEAALMELAEVVVNG